MDNTSDFNGSELQCTNTTITDSLKDSPVRQYAWNVDHTNAMNVANIADSRLEESTLHADGAILAGLTLPSPNSSHNVSIMSTASFALGAPMASSTPAVKRASLCEPSDSARSKRALKRKGPDLSPIQGGSWRKPVKRRASPSSGTNDGGRELEDPEDGCSEQGEAEPDKGEPFTAKKASNIARDLSVVFEEHSDSSLEHGANHDAEEDPRTA
ncbi:hypothetical protein AAVH_03092 [Aphelenchoides avenae]|nr:hypothetical protein AAVH_03092 [Aphelenchus avenae]